jgi:DNA-binding winged helix-turn-helix (wHTH) protein
MREEKLWESQDLSLRLDLTNQWVWKGQQLLKLPPKAFAVLRYLMGHAGQLVTKDELLQAAWSDTTVTEGVLAASIREIRKALADDAQSPRYIETVHRRGYRFLPTMTAQPVTSRQDSVASRGGQSAVRGPRSKVFNPHSAIRIPQFLWLGVTPTSRVSTAC